MIILDRPSPNCRPRTQGRIDAIVLHDTASQTAESALDWLESPASGASTHYLIDRDGMIYRMVPDALRAWHAGTSSLWGEPDVNEFSLGIELVDITGDPYPAPQLDACVQLCSQLVREYPAIWLNRIVGHEHIATPRGRKVDPGLDWPWREFLARVAESVAS